MPALHGQFRSPFLRAAFALLLLWLCHPLSAAEDGRFAGKIRNAMQDMIAEGARLGAPSLQGPVLFFGTTKINGHYALVDGLNARHRCTATFFTRKEDGFVRVSTNVIKSDGSRAVGTVLDPQGPAIAAIRQGSAHYGPADILGKKYETGYEPIRNAAGEVIGVYYIGYLLE